METPKGFLFSLSIWERDLSTEFINKVFRVGRKPFNIEPNETVYVDMMFNGGWFPFYEDKELGLKIIGFPYKGREVSIFFF